MDGYEKTLQWREENRDKHNAYQKADRAKHPERHLLYSARKRARERGTTCTLTREWMVIPAKCPVLGFDLRPDLMGTGRDWRIPTVDEVTHRGGYTPENAAIMSWRANWLKKDATLEELVLLGEWARQRLMDSHNA